MVFERLADQIATARKARGLRRTELAARIGRSPARLTEFERDLTSGRLSKTV
ncbi:helix-turn-helix domain-containing protein (plasmid) [Rhizobium sp. BG4]|nr:helix-turn-helix domain-containing protein [Rhizobium sp. BG4]